MNEEAAFLTAIKKKPKDRTARLVFADWLQERDDPRAAWVRDDAIWEWMKPDAAPPLPRILASVERTSRVPVAALRALAPGVVPELLKALAKFPSGPAYHLQRGMQEIGPAAEPALPALLAAFRSGRKQVRVGAFHCLAGLAPTNASARGAVFTGLSDRDRDVRSIATNLLPKISRCAESARALAEAVRRGHSDSFGVALKALEKLGPLDPALIPDLVRHASRRGGLDAWLVSYDAMDALSRIGLPAVRPLLVAATETWSIEFNMNVEAAIDSMKVDNGKLIRILREVVETAPSERVRHLAAAAWQAREEECTADSLPWILVALRAGDEILIDCACDVLPDLGAAAAPALPAMLELAADSSAGYYGRYYVIGALGRLGEVAEPAIPALFELLDHPGLAHSAARSLARLGRGPSAVVTLLSRAPVTKVAAHIRNALALDGKDCVDVSDVRSVIQTAYRKRNAKSTLADPARLAVKDPPDVPAIRAFLEDPSPATRLVAVFALRHVGTPDAVAGLLAALQVSDRVIRTNAVRALGRVGRGAAGVSEALCAAKKDRTTSVRTAAAQALKELKRS
jgi:uncharacterized protein (TIGR02996 family)